MTDYIQHQKTADEVVADLDGQITERLARNFGNMTLWHADAATLLRRYREVAGEISTLRSQQETDRATIASLRERVGELEADAEFWCGLLGEAQDALDHLGSGDYWVGEWSHDEMVPTWKGAQPVMETAEAYAEDIRRKIKARALLSPSGVGVGGRERSQSQPCTDGPLPILKEAPCDLDWRPISEAPAKAGTYINVRSTTTYRYQPYKPDGARQMGRRGRWQKVQSEYGGWANADLPENADFVLNKSAGDPQ